MTESSKMSDPIAVVHVVDDNPSCLNAFARLMRVAGYSVATFSSAEDCLARITQATRGCVVVDLRMPGCGGLELQSRLAATDNPLPVVFLTGDGDIPSSVKAMQQGAEDFLIKSTSSEKLLEAVERALARDVKDSKRQQRLRELRLLFESLTPREKEVLKHVVQGKLNKQIAAELGTVERTVKLHRTSITRKLKAPSVAEIVRIWTLLQGEDASDLP
jgi:two-component system response regulator FixJ